MRKFFLFLIVSAVLAMLAGCAGTPTPWNQPCTIYDDVGATPENSVIAKLIKNPCVAQKMLVTAAKAPYLWKKQEYIDMFNKWETYIEEIVRGGVTYSQLQTIVIAQVSKLNEEAGVVLLILSDGIFVFNGETALISEIDQTLILMSLEDLKTNVNQLTLIGRQLE